MKTAFELEKIDQHKDQIAVFGREASHFEALERGKINQSHCTSIDDSLYNNLECSEKERNRRHTEKQTSSRPRRTTAGDDNNIVRAVKKIPKTLVSEPFKDDFNIEALPQDANHSSVVRIRR